jgi:hypothetical protein
VFTARYALSPYIKQTRFVFKWLKNVKLSLSTPWRHTGRAEVLLHLFLTSTLDGGEWSNSFPGRFTPGKALQYALYNKSRPRFKLLYTRLTMYKCCRALLLNMREKLFPIHNKYFKIILFNLPLLQNSLTKIQTFDMVSNVIAQL